MGQPAAIGRFGVVSNEPHTVHEWVLHVLGSMLSSIASLNCGLRHPPLFYAPDSPQKRQGY